jgi:hypothetical protein
VNNFTNYLEKLGSNFLVSAMIPSLGWVVACLVVFDPILQISAAFQADNRAYTFLDISLLITILTIVVGFTLTALNTFILKLFEGYVLFNRLPFLKSGHIRRAYRLIDQRETLRKEIVSLEKKKNRSLEEENLLDVLKTDYYITVTTYDQHYPPVHAGIMPTKFGNILKASEAYSGTRYGMDAVQFWPRLLHVIPSSYKQSIDEARNELSFLVNMSALSIVFFYLSIFAILANAPIFPDWERVIENSVRYIVAGLLAWGCNRFFHTAAIFSVGDFGMMIRSAYDLFRLDLLEQFRLKRPKNSVEEFQMWKNLGELIVLGQESMDFQPLRYEVKKQKK